MAGRERWPLRVLQHGTNAEHHQVLTRLENSGSHGGQGGLCRGFNHQITAGHDACYINHCWDVAQRAGEGLGFLYRATVHRRQLGCHLAPINSGGERLPDRP